MSNKAAEKRALHKELKQARYNILRYIDYLDKTRCEFCRSGEAKDSYADRTKCECEAAEEIRKLGEVLSGNKLKIIETYKELLSLNRLSNLTENNLTVEKYTDLKAAGISDSKIQNQLGWHSVKMNQWKRRKGLIRGEKPVDKVEEEPVAVKQEASNPEPKKHDDAADAFRYAAVSSARTARNEVEAIQDQYELDAIGVPLNHKAAEAAQVKNEEAKPIKTIKDSILENITDWIDSQDAKGLPKYGQTLDECPVDKYDWQTMIIEELIDALKYQQKEMRKLRSVPVDAMDAYQKESERTAKPHQHELLNYGLGISGEAGEVADLIKKSFFHGHAIDKEVVKNELGDVLWYVSQIARIAGLSLGEVASANIEKLKKRYPNGFTEKDSINRSV